MSYWNEWETHLKEMLNNTDVLSVIKERHMLNGYEDSKGRMTYARIADKESFGIFSYIISAIAPREYISELPSIAKKALERYAVVYPKYYIQYTELDMPSSDPLPTRSDSRRSSMEDVLEFVDQQEEGVPVIGICILDNTAATMFHGIAFIVWRNSSKDSYQFAYYDPLSYRRKKVRKDGTVYYQGYDYAENVFQSQRFNDAIEFIDLSDFCIKKNEHEFHCPQYIMDAEYCFIYSLYFLFKWVEVGKPLDTVGLSNAVVLSYIVDPNALTRGNSRQSMLYRCTMMSFIVTMLARYIKSLTKKQRRCIEQVDAIQKGLREYGKNWIGYYGFPILIQKLPLSIQS